MMREERMVHVKPSMRKPNCQKKLIPVDEPVEGTIQVIHVHQTSTSLHHKTH